MFRPNLLLGGLFILVGIPFAVLGAASIVHGFLLDGWFWHDWCGYFFCQAFFAVGVLATMAGVASLGYRIYIDEDALTVSAWFGLVTNRYPWMRLKSWALARVDDPETPKRFFLEFDFAGQPWSLHIEVGEVAQPGFMEFLAEVRRYARTQEQPNPIIERAIDSK